MSSVLGSATKLTKRDSVWSVLVGWQEEKKKQKKLSKNSRRLSFKNLIRLSVFPPCMQISFYRPNHSVLVGSGLCNLNPKSWFLFISSAFLRKPWLFAPVPAIFRNSGKAAAPSRSLVGHRRAKRSARRLNS